MVVNPMLKVDIRSQYAWSADSVNTGKVLTVVDSGKVTIDDSRLEEILRAKPEESPEDCRKRFPDMSWQVLAKAIAKDNFKIDITNAQADTLAKRLMQDNNNCEKPFKVLEKPKKKFEFKLFDRGNYNKKDYCTAYEKTGFPHKYTIETEEFKKEIGKMATPKTEKGDHHGKPPKLTILVKTSPLKVKLQAVLPQGFIATSIEWNFKKDTIMTGKLEVERKYDLEHQGPHDATFKATDAKGNIITKTAWFTITEMGKGY